MANNWQPLQLNLPAASVRDIASAPATISAIATHGRSFWVLDNITPLRQMDGRSGGGNVRLYTPATAIRIDNDVFLGTPLPPEEPAAKNPPEGAMIDYYLKIERPGCEGGNLRRQRASWCGAT